MITIKRYPNNRKMYDFTLKDYITLDEVAFYVKRGKEFRITCSETGKDLTKLQLLLLAVKEERQRLKELPNEQ